MTESDRYQVKIDQQSDGKWMSKVVDSLLQRSSLAFLPGELEAHLWASWQLESMRGGEPPTGATPLT